ncbi:MAG: DUF3592 domain-containing protein [Gammaproteobacteria bacterium]|jgi:hypothetical protein
MFNPYTIILGLFIAAGLLATLWGWLIIARARKTQQWPSVEGTIEESFMDNKELFPRISYSYAIDGQAYKRSMEFPGDVTPSQEFARSYLEKYPLGSQVKVYYNPENPDVTTLEPGVGKGDWLVLAIGLGMLIFGVLLVLAGG